MNILGNFIHEIDDENELKLRLIDQEMAGDNCLINRNKDEINEGEANLLIFNHLHCHRKYAEHIKKNELIECKHEWVSHSHWLVFIHTRSWFLIRWSYPINS